MEHKVALVTGAGSGTGRALAEWYAKEGGQVLVSDIQEPGGRETVEAILGAGGEAMFVKADTARPGDHKNQVICTPSAGWAPRKKWPSYAYGSTPIRPRL